MSKTFKSFIEEGRSKAQQIKGQQAMLDQKIKAEYDKVTKEVPSPSARRRKKKEITGVGGSPYQVYRAPMREGYKPLPTEKVSRKLKKINSSMSKNPKDLGFKNVLDKRRASNLESELKTDERERKSQSEFISKMNKGM